MNSKLRTLTLALGAAALMAPVAVAGKPADKPAKSQSKAKAKGKGKAKNAVFRGTVASFDAEAGTLTVDVTSASRWGRDAVGGEPETFTVENVKKIKVADVNADGARDLADFADEDRVHVQARVAKDQDLTAPIAARKVDNKTAKAPEESESATGAEGTDGSDGTDGTAGAEGTEGS